MEPLLIVGVIVGGVVLFVFLSQQGNQQQALAIPALGGSILGMVAFFSMPWIRLPGAGRMLDPLMRNITGWMIATDMPITSDYLRVVLYLTLACFVLALLGGMLGIIGHEVARLVGTIQAVSSLLIGVLLAFSLNDIRTLGLEIDPAMSEMVLDFVGVGTGIGVWMTFLGLLLTGVGGLLLNSPPGRGTRKKTRHRTRGGNRRR